LGVRKVVTQTHGGWVRIWSPVWTSGNSRKILKIGKIEPFPGYLLWIGNNKSALSSESLGRGVSSQEEVAVLPLQRTFSPSFIGWMMFS
jgi:hypothetical protein